MSHYDRDPSTGVLTRTDGGLNLQDMKAVMLDICYPVGSIYQSTENVSPATFLGGTWISLSGYMLRGATSGVRQNTNALDGGADSVTVSSVASHNHNNGATGTMSANNKHTHTVWLEYGAQTNGNYPPYSAHNVQGRPNQFGSYGPYSDKLDVTDINHTHSITANGANYTVNTLPKYKNVYMWERIA